MNLDPKNVKITVNVFDNTHADVTMDVDGGDFVNVRFYDPFDPDGEPYANLCFDRGALVALARAETALMETMFT
jgi:hypothetical protein